MSHVHLPHGICPSLIRQLVERFYARVRIDGALGAVFNARLLNDAAWESHLQTMNRFWESLLLGTRTYRGQTVTTHQVLGALPDELFERWYILFDEATDEIFENNDAYRIKRLARKAGRSIYLRTRDNTQPRSTGQVA